MTATIKQRQAIDWEQVHERLRLAATAMEEVHRISPARAAGVLDERAHRIARIPAQAPEADAVIELILFTLGNECYAVETKCVREILRLKEVTPVPGTPDFLAGITNLRGQILAVFDVRRYFGIAAPDRTEASRVIVLGQERVEFGILADAVHEVVLVRLDALREPPSSVTGNTRDYLRGVTADTVIVLDGAILLNDPRLTIDLGDDNREKS